MGLGEIPIKSRRHFFRQWALLTGGLTFLLLSSSIPPKTYWTPHPHPVALVPEHILWAIAGVESDFCPRAHSKDFRDLGMYQIRDSWAIAGLDPYNCQDAALYASRLLAAHFRALGTWDRATSAYHRGRSWVLHHGVDRDYVQKVKTYKYHR